MYRKQFIKKLNRGRNFQQCDSDPDDHVAMSDIVLDDENE